MIGIYPLVELPTGNADRGLGAGYVRAYFPVWLQKSFGEWTTYGGGGYWLNQGDDTANRNYWFFGWLLQKQVTRQLAIGAEIYHQTSTVAFGATNPIFTQPTTGFNIGAIYDFDDDHHLLVSVGKGLQNAATTNEFSWYVAYQITGAGVFMGGNGPGFLPPHTLAARAVGARARPASSTRGPARLSRPVVRSRRLSRAHALVVILHIQSADFETGEIAHEEAVYAHPIERADIAGQKCAPLRVGQIKGRQRLCRVGFHGGAKRVVAQDLAAEMVHGKNGHNPPGYRFLVSPDGIEPSTY